jgi:hypothetical protein
MFLDLPESEYRHGQALSWYAGKEDHNLCILVDPIAVHGLDESRGTLYTVVPSTAFTGEFNGIVPSIRQESYGCINHFGVMGEYFRREMLKLVLGSYFETKNFVWAGHRVSGNLAIGVEKTMMEYTPADLDRYFYNLFVNGDSGKVREWVTDLLTISDDELVSIERMSDDPRFGRQLTHLMQFLHMSDGWKEKVDMIIFGPVDVGRSRLIFRELIDHLVVELRTGLPDRCGLIHESAKSNKWLPGSVVVEIDAEKVYARTGGLGVGSLTKRPSTTVMLPSVMLQECRRLYVNPSNTPLRKYLSGLGVSPVLTWDELSGKWAGDKDPTHAHELGNDFWRSFHGTPEERREEWRIHMRKELVVPFYMFD